MISYLITTFVCLIGSSSAQFYPLFGNREYSSYVNTPLPNYFSNGYFGRQPLETSRLFSQPIYRFPNTNGYLSSIGNRYNGEYEGIPYGQMSERRNLFDNANRFSGFYNSFPYERANSYGDFNADIFNINRNDDFYRRKLENELLNINKEEEILEERKKYVKLELESLDLNNYNNFPVDNYEGKNTLPNFNNEENNIEWPNQEKFTNSFDNSRTFDENENFKNELPTKNYFENTNKRRFYDDEDKFNKNDDFNKDLLFKDRVESQISNPNKDEFDSPGEENFKSKTFSSDNVMNGDAFDTDKVKPTAVNDVFKLMFPSSDDEKPKITSDNNDIETNEDFENEKVKPKKITDNIFENDEEVPTTPDSLFLDGFYGKDSNDVRKNSREQDLDSSNTEHSDTTENNLFSNYGLFGSDQAATSNDDLTELDSDSKDKINPQNNPIDKSDISDSDMFDDDELKPTNKPTGNNDAINAETSDNYFPDNGLFDIKELEPKRRTTTENVISKDIFVPKVKVNIVSRPTTKAYDFEKEPRKSMASRFVHRPPPHRAPSFFSFLRNLF